MPTEHASLKSEESASVVENMTLAEAKKVLAGLLKIGTVDEQAVTIQLESIRRATEQQIEVASKIAEQEQVRTLQYYKAQYENLNSKSKSRCSWEEIQTRLLADNGHKLKLAEALQNKGVLFGVDKSGKALFADKGVEPVLTGMTYHQTRDRVLYQHDETGKKIMRDREPVPTGYEMFPKTEISMYEKNTGEPIVASSSRKEQRSIWLESGAIPRAARNARFYPRYGVARVSNVYPRTDYPKNGTKRLLRV